MLTERKHIALLGAVAALAFPAAASAAQHDHLPPRVRLRADATSAVGSGAVGSGAIGLGEAKAVSGPLLDPVERYSRLIVTTAERTEHRHKVHARHARKHREAREEEEQFAQLPGGVSMETLETIAACESGGNPEAVSPEGTYRGKYQFDQGTWESVGGHGDPAQAPEAEQDYRAALLYSESGSSPWPVCG
ncbi:MAG TPA: transglycosylase family protein [Solirubrobacterales bacterium]|nr:transglycosylase family protein [Solirubrobacterales bacterium]